MVPPRDADLQKDGRGTGGPFTAKPPPRLLPGWPLIVGESGHPCGEPPKSEEEGAGISEAGHRCPKALHWGGGFE